MRVQLDSQYLVLAWRLEMYAVIVTAIIICFTDDICDILASQGLKHNVVLNRRAQNEKLSVLKFYHDYDTR